MQRIQVDFNSMIGSVVPIPRWGESCAVNETVVVFDEGTDDYLACVVGVSKTTVFIEVREPVSL